MTVQQPDQRSAAGTARLLIVVPVALVSFFYINMLEYALPLYFEARSEAARLAGGSFPLDVWAEVVKYKVLPWIVGPLLAGLLARRYGERAVWCGALLGKVLIPLALTTHPHPNLISALAIWQGLTGAMMWIAGISLVQMVAPEKKGFSNGAMMVSLGVGSVFGQLGGRCLIYYDEFASLLGAGNWSDFGARLLNLEPTMSAPALADFELMFWLLTVTTLLSATFIGLWGQRPGRFDHALAPGWSQTIGDLQRLTRDPKFWALVAALCLFGGPVFQASNQFLPYRAKEMGLILAGGADNGWIWLNLLKVAMWIPGGAAVGLLAGRRAPGIAAVGMLGCFSLAVLAIGASQLVWQLFWSVAAFEFVRQFMRWSHSGYMSEHMPDDLRATTIGLTITISGLGSTVFTWIAPRIWDPNAAEFQATGPFLAAAVCGLAGCVGLFLFDRLRPIRGVAVAEPASEGLAPSGGHAAGD
ncbi:MAG: MFS transporter [Pirellulales bacterium]|nr:MFS transporter [Pirellulales bacterium]